VAVDGSDDSRWFAEYLDAFAACGRGERETGSLLGYYGVPLLLTTGDGFFALRSDGVEISRLTATYLVTDGPAGRRISVLAVHAPDRLGAGGEVRGADP
jgi:hypothetical protein